MHSDKKLISYDFPVLFIALVPGLISFLILSEDITYNTKILMLIGIFLSILGVKYPEITLAIFLAIGNIKGDPRLSSLLHTDATVALAMLIIASILIRVVFKKQMPKFPKEFLLYFPFIFMMLISLSYTPHFHIGLDKASRFIVLTGLAIISPFFLLESPKKMERFFWTFLTIGLLTGLNSFTMLGGYERFTAPSGLTIQLGYMAAVGIAVTWYLIVLPDQSFCKKVSGFLIMILLFVTLVGSGARSATLAVSVCVLISFFFYRRSISYFFIIVVLAFLTLSTVDIPARSYEYLGTLIYYDIHDLFGFRATVMKLGLNLTMQYPLLGVGIGGYPFYSPNPHLYNWPHNIMLEISSEMGMLAALAAFALIICSFWETTKQLMDRDSKYKRLSRLVLALLIIGFVTMLNTGDINCVRPMWSYMSLPFVLRLF